MAKKVEDLCVGDAVDLSTCPFLKDHPTAEFEFAVVDYVNHETSACTVIGYEGIDHVGYPTGTVLGLKEEPTSSRSARP